MGRPPAAFLSVLFFTLLSAIATAQSKGPTQAELSTVATNVADWLHPNHDYGGGRASLPREPPRLSWRHIRHDDLFDYRPRRGYLPRPLAPRLEAKGTGEL